MSKASPQLSRHPCLRKMWNAIKVFGLLFVFSFILMAGFIYYKTVTDPHYVTHDSSLPCFQSETVRIRVSDTIFYVPKIFGRGLMAHFGVKTDRGYDYCQSPEDAPYIMESLLLYPISWDPESEWFSKNDEPFGDAPLIIRVFDPKGRNPYYHDFFRNELEKIGLSLEKIQTLPREGDFFVTGEKPTYYISPKNFSSEGKFDLLFECGFREVHSEKGTLLRGRSCTTYTPLFNGLYIKLTLHKQDTTADPKQWRNIHYRLVKFLHAMTIPPKRGANTMKE